VSEFSNEREQARSEPAAPRRAPRVAASPALLRLQRSAGNRAVTALISREPKVDDETRVRRAAPGPAGEEPEGAEVEWEEFGPLGKFMDEVVEHSLEEAHIHSGLAGMFAKAWDIYEVIEFGRTGDVEHLGGPAATLAGKLADGLEIVEGVSGSRVAAVGKIGGRAVLVAWTTYESFKLGAWIRGMIDAQSRAEDLARDRWRHAMMHHVWLDFMGALKEDRAGKFDEIAGGQSRYGEIPALTHWAATRWIEMMNEASDDWKTLLPWWQENARWLAEHAADEATFREGFGETSHGADVAQRREAIRSVVKHLAGHFARVREFALDPANWALTERQKEILGSTPMITPGNSSAAP
jgi:hypothetical protein